MLEFDHEHAELCRTSLARMLEFAGIHPDRSATAREAQPVNPLLPALLTTPLARHRARPHIRKHLPFGHLMSHAAGSSLADALRDRYVLERERGGMATVYLARDLKHDHPVALKLLRPELAATQGPDRFQREIKLAARLQHPHILSVHDSGEAAAQLTDDVADVFLTLLTNGKVTQDRAGPHGDLLADFPYLGPPHNA